MSSSKRKNDFDSGLTGSSKKQRSEKGPSSNGGLSQDLPHPPALNAQLEKAVFTHSSIATQNPDNPEMVNYERLEFLGDAQLELMASEVIFERYNSSTPGKMSAVREKMLRNDLLSRYSQSYGFDKRLKMAFGHEQPRDLTKIQADIFEAYIAAIILSDSNRHRGYDTAKAWIVQLWESVLASLGMKQLVSDVKSKEELGRQILVPGIKLQYIDEKPPVLHKAKGSQTYFIGVFITGWGFDNQHLGSGQGESKNVAGQDAAKEALKSPLLDEMKVKRKAYLEARQKVEAAQNDETEILSTKASGVM